jgi:hypothetical protein
MGAHAKKKESKFKVGDKVSYDKAFLRQVGGYHRDAEGQCMADRKGVVVEIIPRDGQIPASAKILWSGEPTPSGALLVNLQTARTHSCSM